MDLTSFSYIHIYMNFLAAHAVLNLPTCRLSWMTDRYLKFHMVQTGLSTP